jgi:hypothetical protein
LIISQYIINFLVDLHFRLISVFFLSIYARFT